VLPEGTLVIPTFNFKFNDGIPYNFYSTKSHMGILTKCARTHPLALRTLNPVYSFAAFGKNSHLFDGIDNKSWYGSDSLFAFIHKLNFNICILDLEDKDSMTFAHYCEERYKALWRHYKEFKGKYTSKDKITTIKKYLGYVINLEEGVISTFNPASELLRDSKLHKSNRPFVNSGLRFIRAKTYFKFFHKLYKQEKCRPYFYDINK
jgi:aminoglycoside 3-N-acetyltransferase